MPSIREVAKEAGVSIATVSRVINGNSSVAPELKSQVLAAIERCDYLPSVGRRTCDSVALLYVGPFTPESPYDSACIAGIINTMRKGNYDLAVVDMARDKLPDESFRQFFARKGICGAIVRSTAADRAILTKIAEEPFPWSCWATTSTTPRCRLCTPARGMQAARRCSTSCRWVIAISPLRPAIATMATMAIGTRRTAR